MPETIFLPKWGMTMTEGRVARWLKQVGDRVKADEELVEIETDKAMSVVTAPIDGVLTQILVEADNTVPVGTELGTITPL
jgi:pyruvate dehydrogenase E2 component (dihydrolipoamide acetyltransferase)